MQLTTLKALAQARGLNQSDLARAANVTRQRVSQWFRSEAADDRVNITSVHLQELARALGVRADELLGPLPLLEDAEERRHETTKLLWDRLYPDIVAFAIAAGSGQPQALARLVQVYGLYASARMVGKSVWTRFPQYKKYVHPARRSGLEKLWAFNMSRTRS